MMSRSGLRVNCTLVSMSVFVCIHVMRVLLKQIRWLKVLVVHPHPLHTLAKTQVRQKLQPTCLHPHQWAQRAEKRQEGPRTKVHRDPGPLSSFVLKNGEVQEQLLLAARDIWDEPFHQKQSLELWVCRLQEGGGRREEKGEAVYKTKGTLCQINVEQTPHSSFRSAAAGGRGRAIKWRKKPLKLTWVTSVTAQRGPRGLPYGARLIICSGTTEGNPARTNSSASSAPSSTQRQHVSAFWLAVKVLSLTLCLN